MIVELCRQLTKCSFLFSFCSAPARARSPCLHNFILCAGRLSLEFITTKKPKDAFRLTFRCFSPFRWAKLAWICLLLSELRSWFHFVFWKFLWPALFWFSSLNELGTLFGCICDHALRPSKQIPFILRSTCAWSYSRVRAQKNKQICRLTPKQNICFQFYLIIVLRARW